MSGQIVNNIIFKAIADFSDVNNNIQKLGSYFSKLKLPNNLGNQLKNSVSELETKFANLQKILSGGIKTKADFSAFEKAAKEVDIAIASVEKGFNKINDKHIEASILDTSRVKEAQAEVEKIKKSYSEVLNFGGKNNTNKFFGADAVANLTKLIGTTKGLNTKFTALKEAFKVGDIDQINAALEKMIQHVKQYQDSFNRTKGFGGTRGDDMLKVLEGMQNALPSITSGLDVANQKLEKAKQISGKELNLNSWKSGFQNFVSGIDQAISKERELAQQTMNVSSQLTNLQTSANYFFGLQNMFYLMKRGVQDTLETVKELDKAMTETAVVTDMSVGDLWKQLPDYTDLANKLGATTKGAYETMTLYYQQGLDKDQTFEIGEETMKMARIAGLDYAETTNMMTAALRGFNMELNQTSAKRVNDVYSKLAAITASDTKELGLAMERTASIAHSANMDFGTTTAFLAQMIETTREAPENLGTAMKTIIARFQELKENPMEIGEVEGEEVSYNRVDKALKSIGVQLVDSKDKFRDLDDVFLDISSKWDGLTQTQQRYIATTAAGSRQQSRFIAMMDNYKRTLELVDAAANSEGASDVQFSKTLDSMESKLNQLHNAWDNFMMGITNNEFLKWAVDMGTSFVGIVDNIINAISKATGPLKDFTKSTLSLGTLALGLGFGGKVVNKGLGVIGNLVDPQGKGSKGFFSGMTGRKEAGNAQLATQINSPIVAAINNILSFLSGKESNQNNFRAKVDPSESLNRYGQARKNLTSLMTNTEERLDQSGKIKRINSSFSLQQVGENFQGLNLGEARSLYKSSPILQKKIKETFSKATNKLDLSKQGRRTAEQYAEYVSKSMSSGQISIGKGIKEGTDLFRIADNIKESAPETAKAIKEQIYNEAFKKENLDKETFNRFRRAADRRGLEGDERKAFIQESQARTYSAKQSLEYRKDPSMQLSKAQSAMVKFNTVASSAGQTVAQLGNIFSSAGFSTAGAVFSKIGSAIMTMGMAAETAIVITNELGMSLKALATNPIVLGLAAVTAVAGIGMAFSKMGDEQVKKARKAGKEIEKAYKDTTEKTTRNLSKIEEYRGDFERLSKGVDSNGYNIDLGTEEYKDYQKIVKDLIKMNPELVQGYNAQGQAIIDKNKAIKESIKYQEQQKEDAEKEYTKPGSLTKLITARNTKKRFEYGFDQGGGKIGGSKVSGAQGTPDDSQFKKDAEEIVTNIKNAGKNGEEVLKELGKQYNVDFGNLNREGIKAIQQHGSEMMDYVTENIKKGSQTQLDAVQDSIATLGKHTEGFEKVIEPVYQNLSTYMSKQGVFKSIPEEFRTVLDSRIKDIAGQKYDEKGKPMTGESMQKMAVKAANEIQDLKGHSEDYKEAMEDVSNAQEKFSQNLNFGEYADSTKDAIQSLQDIKAEFDKGTSDTDRAMSEWVNNQIEKIQNFTTEGSTSLAEGFNTMSATIESANQSYERYQEEIKKGDYYTGSDNLKQIYDDATSEKNFAGKGSRSMYVGATEILGEDYVLEKSTKKVKKHLKEVGKYLTEDKSGVDSFLVDLRDKFQNVNLDEEIFGKGQQIKDFIRVTKDGGLNFDKMMDFDDTKMESMASSLGMSLETFTSLLNKAQQFYDIDFANIDKLREGLATSETTLFGREKDGKRNLYTKESDFIQEGLSQGLTIEKIKGIMKNMSKEGTVFMKSASDMTANQMSKYFKDWQISDGTIKVDGKTKNTTDTNRFIGSFDQANYNKEEIEKLYNKAIEGGLISDSGTVDFNDAYKEYAEKEEHPEIEHLTNISGKLDNIQSSIDAQNGILSSENKKKYEDLSGKEHDKKVKDIYEDPNKFSSTKNYNETKGKLEAEVQKESDAIKQLELIRKGADEKTREQIDKILNGKDGKSGLRADYARDQKRQDNLDKGWKEENKKAYNSFKESGFKVEGKDKAKVQEYGVDFNNAINQKSVVTGVNQFVQALKNSGVQNQNALKAQYVDQKFGEIKSLNDFVSARKALGNVDKTTEGKLDKLQSALEKNSQSVDKNTSKKDKDNKSNKDNKNKERQAPKDSKSGQGKDGKKSDKQSGKFNINKIGKSIFSGISNWIKGAVKKGDKSSKTSDGSGGKKGSSGTSSTGVKVDGKKSIEQASKSLSKIKNKTVKLTIKTSGKSAITKIKNAIKSIKNKTAKIKAKVTGSSAVQKIKKLISSLKNKTVKVKADTGDSIEKVTTLRSRIKSLHNKKVSVTVTVHDNGLDSAINKYDRLKDKTVNVTVEKSEGGGKGGKKNKKSWTGTRNTLPVNPPLSFNSAANGLNNGVKKAKKGTQPTLTGEKGYEVGWLPSEGRATILGLKGPEIVDLPRDAVVYNHDQSKKIVKGNQNRPTIGSMLEGNAKGFDDGSGSGSGSKKKSKDTSSNDTKSAAKDAKSAAKNSKKASGKWLSAGTIWGRITGKVSSWWDNMSRKIDAATRTFNKAMDKVSKALNSTVATGPKVFKALTEASKKAAVAIQNNIIAYKKASKTLNRLVGHKDADKINEYNKLNKKKKRTKKQNKRLKKLRAWGKKKGYIKKNGKLSPKGNKTRKKRYVASISYDKTGTKILGKGKKGKKLAKKYKTFLSLKNKKKKTKKFKSARKALRKQGIINKNGKLTKKGKKIIKTKKINKNKKEKVNLSKYIKRDKKTGALVIDDKALNKIKDKNKKKAIQDKANEKINDYNQKRTDALDALKDIQDQATSTGEELYEKFHSWKRTLEEIEVISQRIAELSERISIAEARSAKANNELLAGETANIAKAAKTMSKAIEDFIRFNEQSIEEIKQSRDKIGKKMDKENSDTDEKKAVTDTTKKYNDITAKINKLKSKYNLKSVEDLYRLSSNEQYIELLAKQREANLEKEKAESDLKVQQAVTKIAKGKKNADGTYTYSIDWDLFDQYANSEDYTSEQMDEIQERISTLISLNSDYLKTMTDELNTENAILERLAQIRKDISDGSQKLAQVLMDREQRVVDNLSKINDTIKNATGKILDDVRDALDKRRQQDQNQKTEKSISDKQNRLAYLQNDTAGGHQVEILQLQKEIGDEQQSYRETLEDQLLTNLQKQADQASAQRERQITLLQTMVNWNKESGVYARQIDDWLNDPKKFETHIKNAFRESILGDQFETWITKENASEEAFSETSTLTGNVDKYLKDRKELIDKANNAIKAAEQKYAEAQNGKYKGYVTPEQLATLKSRTDTLRAAVQSGTQGEIKDALGSADDGTGVLGAQKVVQSGMDRKAEDDKKAAEEAARKAAERAAAERAAAEEAAAQEQAYSFTKSINALALRPKTNPLTNSEKKEFVKRYDSLSSLAKSKIDSAIKSKIEQFRYDISPEGIYRTAVYNAGVNGVIGAKEFLSVAEKANNAGYTAATYMQDLANTEPSLGYGGLKWKQVIKAAKDAGYSKYRMAATFSSEAFINAYNSVYGANAYKEAKKYIKKNNVKGYKMGGLADYTGPAWLDGTKSKPELVLDAQDTKNFLALRDTLSGLQNTQFTPQSSGDLNFDIDINVEKIDNDYDVKKVAEAVKKEIVQSAKYRNVNIVRNLK